ncbi:MAG: PQQ-dependent sugar dehydrogenase [Promethearchaeota archaeon]
MEKKSILSIAIIFGTILGLGISFGTIILLDTRKNPPINYEYDIQNAFPNITFTRPLGIYDSEDGTNRLFVVEQGGRILLIENNKNITKYEIFLDIGDKIYFGGERGLLGFALHPNDTINGYFFVYYSEKGTGDSVLSRFKVNSTNPNIANKTSEKVLLKITQPYSNHNGGQIGFGPDNFLYIGLGDGGSGGDPLNNGQNRQTLLGTILRIDIDAGDPYAIPNDNPFYGNLNGWAEEIYAFGFRNPWRFSFDPVTGFLWVADVGQDHWEEIDIVENGNNYGWNTREGSHDYKPGTNVTIIQDPIFEYSHSVGDSITGGYVYRGSILTDLIGKYVYGDYVSGRIWALEYAGDVVLNNTLLIDTNLKISSFGIDSNNELLICAFDGNIYKLI